MEKIEPRRTAPVIRIVLYSGDNRHQANVLERPPASAVPHARLGILRVDNRAGKDASVLLHCSDGQPTAIAALAAECSSLAN